jgi:hypothetical protein
MTTTGPLLMTAGVLSVTKRDRDRKGKRERERERERERDREKDFFLLRY